MNSTETSIISTQKKSRSTRIIPKDPEFRKIRSEGRAALIRRTARSKTPVRLLASEWKPSTTMWRLARRTSWKKQVKAGKPFFVWVNFTHMHFRTHVKPESRGQSGRWMSEYADAMIDHDKNVERFSIKSTNWA